MREREQTQVEEQLQNGALKLSGRGPLPPPKRAVISYEAFEREAVIQRIVDHLRKCDLETLEGVACILEQGRFSH